MSVDFEQIEALEEDDGYMEALLLSEPEPSILVELALTIAEGQLVIDTLTYAMGWDEDNYEALEIVTNKVNLELLRLSVG